ncbi:MAG: long-chain fatty acid--CoA ligase [Frankiales bacterium]|nr:long-chain fatty acid--CoA ligase [Frankiales bacterium]
MDLGLLLDMAVSGGPDRLVLGPRAGGTSAGELQQRAFAGARLVQEAGAAHLVFVATSGPAFPVALFAAAAAGVPLVPLNYRQPTDVLVDLVGQNAPVYLVAEQPLLDAVGLPADRACTPQEWMERTRPGAEPLEAPAGAAEPDDVALLLYTSGTTAAPKAAVLRHRNLTAYVLATIDFQSADESEASLVSVPPYHIAGVANTVSNLYAGRRVVHLPAFTPEAWLDTVREEGITHALVVPTMLARVVEHLETTGGTAPALRSLAYGGASMPSRVIERALALFPDTGFVNAYGLTETSSTIALLGPDDHRAAAASDDPQVRARLGSAGRVVPGVDLELRDENGAPVAQGEVGDLYVRGEQVSGEYRGKTAGPSGGWFATRDRAWLDDEGFLFIEGRSDDTIIRGGENIAPAEVEHVLQLHEDVADAAVVGLPDEEWGQRIAASVVLRTGAAATPEDLRTWVRSHLRGAKTPDLVVLVAELPRTDTGKLLRRQVAADLTARAEPLPA